MIRKYIVDTRVCPFQADGQFEDGSYFHIRYRNCRCSSVFILFLLDNQNTTAKAFYSECYSTSMFSSEDSMNDVEAILMLESFIQVS